MCGIWYTIIPIEYDASMWFDVYMEVSIMPWSHSWMVYNDNSHSYELMIWGYPFCKKPPHPTQSFPILFIFPTDKLEEYFCLELVNFTVGYGCPAMNPGSAAKSSPSQSNSINLPCRNLSRRGEGSPALDPEAIDQLTDATVTPQPSTGSTGHENPVLGLRENVQLDSKNWCHTLCTYVCIYIYRFILIDW